MIRRRTLHALAAAAALPLVAGLGVALALDLAMSPVPALARGGDGDRGAGNGDDAKKKSTPEWKALEAVGAEIQAKDAQALADRVRRKGKVRIKLGAERDGEYAPDQAKAVLDDWFADKRDLRLELASVKDLLGEFKLTFRKDGSDKLLERRLGVTLEKKEKDKGEGWFLARIEIL